MERALEVFLGFMVVICILMLVLIPIGCVSSLKEQQRLEEEMKADNCQSISKVPTGKTIYCGKACWRKEIREEFSCKSGIKVIVE